MKKFMLVVTVVGLFLLIAGCAGAAKSGTTTTASSDATTTATDQGSLTPGGDQGTTASTDQVPTSAPDQTTDTSTEDTSTTLPSDTTATAAVAGAGASSTIVHEQNAPRFAYAGTWKKVSASSASGGASHLPTAPGLGDHPLHRHPSRLDRQGIAGLRPGHGHGGRWHRPHRGPLQHRARCGRRPCGRPAPSVEQAHTVVISWTGKKKAAATGTNINVDAIQVTGVLTGRYQQTNAKLSYAGTWNTTSSSSASGGSFTYADTSGASVTIHFTGIDLAWIAKTGPVYGQAKVTVDGTKTYTVNLYSAKTAGRSASGARGSWRWGPIPSRSIGREPRARRRPAPTSTSTPLT